MPITGLQLITVTGTFKNLDGTPSAGTVTFVATVVLTNDAADEIVHPVTFVVTLDGTGSFSIDLPATDDPDLTPTGWAYTVTEDIIGSNATRTYGIFLPYDDADQTIDLADITPVFPVPAVETYALVDHTHDDLETPIVLESTDAAMIPLILQGHSTQTADLQQWQNSVGVLTRVTASGQLGIGVVPTEAPLEIYAGGNIPAKFASASSYNTEVIMDNESGGLSANRRRWAWMIGGTAGPIPHGSLAIYDGTYGAHRLFVGGGAQGGKVGVNIATTPDAQFQVNTAAASYVGLIVKGGTGQTGDLQQWQNSVGAVSTKIGPAGNFGSVMVFTSGALTGLGGAPQAWFTVPAANLIPIGVRGAASQTADLQQWQDSTGTVLTRISSTGKMIMSTSSGTLNLGGDGSYPIDIAAYQTYGLRIRNYNAETVPTYNVELGGFSGIINTLRTQSPSAIALVVQGAASQTADLFQIQNSAAGNIFRVAPDGSLYGKSLNGAWSLVPDASSRSVLTPGAGALLISGGLVMDKASLDAASQISLLNNTPITSSSGDILLLPGVGFSVKVTAGSDSSVAAIVKGSAAQTADLQQWQNSAGTVLARTDSTGAFFSGSFNASEFLFAGSGVAFSGGTPLQVTARTGLADRVLAIIKGGAGQTGDLQQWQNSAGTVLARISSGGIGVFPQGLLSSTLGADTAASILVQTSGLTTQSTMNVRGASGQTGDLQQWQNSSGTMLASITSAGTLVAGKPGLNLRLVGGGTDLLDGGLFVDTNGIMYVSNWTTSRGIRLDVNGDLVTLGSGKVGINISSPGAQLHVNNAAAATVGLIVRGAASQSTDLQQWQNSAGTVISRIASDGSLSINNTSTTALSVTRSTDGYVVLDADTSALLARATYSFLAGGSVLGSSLLNVNNASGLVSVVSASSGYVPFTVTGAAEQAADLQRWQDSSGTVLARITSAGAVSLTTNGNVIPLTVRGSGTQTTDLQRWTSLAGVVRASISAAGQFYSAGLAVGVEQGLNLATQIAMFQPTTAGTIPLVSKGAASQTADLMQWQNNAGTALAAVLAAGDLEFFNTALGPIVRSPDGTRYRIKVANGGALSTVAA